MSSSKSDAASTAGVVKFYLIVYNIYCKKEFLEVG
jgi:hypothetical protein